MPPRAQGIDAAHCLASNLYSFLAQPRGDRPAALRFWKNGQLGAVGGGVGAEEGVVKRGVLYELPDEGRNAIRAAAVQAALSLLLSTLEEK